MLSKMDFNYFSDRSYGSSPESFAPRRSQQLRFDQNHSHGLYKAARPVSFMDARSTSSIDLLMEEFRLNGVDSPYDPEMESFNRRSGLLGVGPPSYHRSWPEPELTPLPQSRRTVPPHFSSNEGSTARTSPIDEDTIDKFRMLCSLTLMYALQDYERAAGHRNEGRGCAFCRSNGERAAWYQAHVLRSAGRLCCPVLRAHVCRRCGATGDDAHTLNYCPLSSQNDRNKSAAVMRSVRMSSGRRRSQRTRSQYVHFGQATPSAILDEHVYNSQELYPLDPTWAELEKKLMQ